MSLALFHEVSARAIQTVLDEQNQPYFKRANLGKHLGMISSLVFMMQSKLLFNLKNPGHSR